MRKLTKVQVLESFTYCYDDLKAAVKKDTIAVAEEWSNYTDMLHRDGEITDWQVNNWANPF